MAKYKKVFVEWDTDGENPKDLDLPEVIEVPTNLDDDEVADWLSDEYGYCVESYYELNN